MYSAHNGYLLVLTTWVCSEECVCGCLLLVVFHHWMNAVAGTCCTDIVCGMGGSGAADGSWFTKPTQVGFRLRGTPNSSMFCICRHIAANTSVYGMQTVSLLLDCLTFLLLIYTVQYIVCSWKLFYILTCNWMSGVLFCAILSVLVCH